MMRRLSIVVLCVVLCAGMLAGCGQSGSKTFTVGFDQEFPPMGFVEDGEFVGFDIDLATEAAGRMKLELKLQPIDWAAKDMELESGNIDCVWNGFTMNEDRLDKYEWTSAYMNNRQVMVVMADSAYQSLGDLEGKSIALQLDSSGEAAMNRSEEYKAKVTVVPVDTMLTALMNLESGAVDAVLMDEIVARYSIEKRGAAYRVLDEALATEFFGVGFKKGNTAGRDQLEKILQEMAKDGTMAKISQSWFGEDITILG